MFLSRTLNYPTYNKNNEKLQYSSTFATQFKLASSDAVTWRWLLYCKRSGENVTTLRRPINAAVVLVLDFESARKSSSHVFLLMFLIEVDTLLAEIDYKRIASPLLIITSNIMTKPTMLFLALNRTLFGTVSTIYHYLIVKILSNSTN